MKKAKKKSAGVQTVMNTTGTQPWLRDMSDEQLAAIMHQDGPARMLSPAGSGKTRVVVHRIARMVAEGVSADRILALTFSKKAADEMSARASKLGNDGVRVGTWHSVALQILREDKHVCAGWSIGDSSRAALKQVLGFRGMDWKSADTNKVADFISKCKAHLHAPDSPEALERAQRHFGRFATFATRAFQLYNDECELKEILTYDDFLVRVVDHLESNPEVLNRWQARWDYLIQDEAQDENPAQKRIVRLLASEHRNYMAVGDVMQAIYGFRESTPDSLVAFEDEWPDAKTYWLTGNYRSGSDIIDAANAIVSRARVKNYEGRALVARRESIGNVIVHACEDLEDEAGMFAENVRDTVAAGDAKYSDHCALFRTNAQSRALEEALIGERIPYVVVGGMSFYERKEIKQLLAYLRLAEGRGEVEDVERCINAPFRFLGKAFVTRVVASVDDMIEDGDTATIDWPSVVRDVAQQERIQFRQKESAEGWAAMLGRMAKRVQEKGKPGIILDDLTRETRFIEWITKEEGEETLEVSQGANVKELIRVAERFATTKELLDFIDHTIREARSQREDRQAGGNRVLLMNVHRSKGLEWPRVWIAGFNEKIFPHPMGDQEEERRLAYVAVTRARDVLTVSHVATFATRAGIQDALPSRFIHEMDSAVAARTAGIFKAPEGSTLAGMIDEEMAAISAGQE